MAVFPNDFELIYSKAVQELGEMVYEFQPDLLMAIPRAGILVGYSAQCYLELMYDKKVPLEYAHVRRISPLEHFINTDDLEQRKETIVGRRIAFLDDVSGGISPKCANTIGKPMRYVQENLNPSAIQGFCFLSSTYLKLGMGKSAWGKEGWEDLFSENSSLIFVSDRYVPIEELLKKLETKEDKDSDDETEITRYRFLLERKKIVETRMREVIESVVEKSKYKP